MNWLTKLFKKLFAGEIAAKVIPITDEQIIERYVLTGSEFGSVVSMIYMGECIGFGELLQTWEDAEFDYAMLGFRTCSLDDFVGYGGYGTPLPGLRVARFVDEQPVFHAKYYRETYLGKVGPAIDYARMMIDGEVQTGRYEMPTTEHLVTRK